MAHFDEITEVATIHDIHGMTLGKAESTHQEAQATGPV